MKEFFKSHPRVFRFFIIIIILASILSLMGIRTVYKNEILKNNPIVDLSAEQLIALYNSFDMSVPDCLNYFDDEDTLTNLPWVAPGIIGKDVNEQWVADCLDKKEMIYSPATGAVAYRGHDYSSLYLQLPGEKAQKVGSLASQYYLSPLNGDLFFVGASPSIFATKNTEVSLYLYRNATRILLADDIDAYGMSYSVSPNGRYLAYQSFYPDDATGYRNNVIKLIDLETINCSMLDTPIFEDKDGRRIPVGVSNDGNLIYFSSSYDRKPIAYVQNRESQSITLLCQDANGGDVYNEAKTYDDKTDRNLYTSMTFHFYFNVDATQVLCAGNYSAFLFTQGKNPTKISNDRIHILTNNSIVQQRSSSGSGYLSSNIINWMPVDNLSTFTFYESPTSRYDFDFSDDFILAETSAVKIYQDGMVQTIFEDVSGYYYYDEHAKEFTYLTSDDKLVRIDYSSGVSLKYDIAENVVKYVCAYDSDDVYFVGSEQTNSDINALYRWTPVTGEQKIGDLTNNIINIFVSPNGEHVYCLDSIPGDKGDDYLYYYNISMQTMQSVFTDMYISSYPVSNDGVSYFGITRYVDDAWTYMLWRVDSGGKSKIGRQY